VSPKHWSKALYAALVAAQTGFVAATLPVGDGGATLTAPEITLIVFAALIAGLGTYAIPNVPEDRDSVSLRPEG
jgi:hypothetical protein